MRLSHNESGEPPFIEFIGVYGHIDKWVYTSSRKGIAIEHHIAIDVDALVGQCDCEDFTYRMKRGILNEDETLCKHLKIIKTAYLKKEPPQVAQSA